MMCTHYTNKNEIFVGKSHKNKMSITSKYYIENAKKLGLLEDNLSVQDIRDKLQKLSTIFSKSTLEELGINSVEVDEDEKNTTLQNEKDEPSKNVTLSFWSRARIDLEKDEDDNTTPQNEKEEPSKNKDSFWDLAKVSLKGDEIDFPLDVTDLVFLKDGIPSYKVCLVKGRGYCLTFKSLASVKLSVFCDDRLLKLFAKKYNLPGRFYEGISGEHYAHEKCECCDIF